MTKYRIDFLDSTHQPALLDEGDCLSEKLTIHNSPILFGCRIGICGTCAIEVESSDEELPPKTIDEKTYLDALAPDRPRVRLSCQIKINTNMKIRKTEI